LDYEAEERLNELRLLEAVETGASYLATACPYCLLMLDSAAVSLNLDHKIKVVSVAELLLQSVMISSEEVEQ